MFLHNGSYYLTHNSSSFTDESYKVKYLVCEGAAALHACPQWSARQSDAVVLLKTGSSLSIHIDAVLGRTPQEWCSIEV